MDFRQSDSCTLKVSGKSRIEYSEIVRLQLDRVSRCHLVNRILWTLAGKFHWNAPIGTPSRYSGIWSSSDPSTSSIGDMPSLGLRDIWKRPHKSPASSNSNFMYSSRHFLTNRPSIEDIEMGFTTFASMVEGRREER